MSNGQLSDGVDANQALMEAFDETYRVLNVRDIGGKLVPDVFDEIDLTYVVVGPGSGQIRTVTYKLQSLIIATLTLTYDGSDRISMIVKT